MYILLETTIDKELVTELKKSEQKTRTTEVIGIYETFQLAASAKKELITEFLNYHGLYRKNITDIDDYWKCELDEQIYLIEIEEQYVVLDEKRYIDHESMIDLTNFTKENIWYKIKLVGHKRVEYIQSVRDGVIKTTLSAEKGRKYKSIKYLEEIYLPIIRRIVKGDRKICIDEIVQRDLRVYRRNIDLAKKNSEMLGDL